LPHLSVRDNVAFPLKVQGVSRRERSVRAQQFIELVGLSGREDSYPSELSGGEQQRVGIARSLAVDTELWFLDEPFSALDPLIRRQMQDEFLRLQRLLHKTIVFVTHDFLEAVRIADRVAIMKNGSIVQVGTPADLVLRPKTDYVAEFTRDVPLSRILTAADVLVPPQFDSVHTTPRVNPDVSLHELMSIFADGASTIAVIADTGDCLGEITPQSIFQQLTAVHTANRSQ
jgi:glycine betaine/proline transport system ATP-binding protein